MLASGLPGAVVISVFSTDLAENSGFILERVVPATALIFSEPDLTLPGTSISRRSEIDPSLLSCSRPIIHLGRAIHKVTTTLPTLPGQLLRIAVPPVLRPSYDTFIERFGTAISPFIDLYAYARYRVNQYKAAALDKARLSCLIPTIRRPFEPIFEHLRCKLGLTEDEFMEAPPCSPSICLSTPHLETREITVSKPIPNMTPMNLNVQTIDDCFDNMSKLQFGARVLIKLVDDSCDNPKFTDRCTRLFEDRKIVVQDDCSTLGYA